MTEAQAIEALLQHWKTTWEALHPTDVPWTPDNEAFDSVAKWARITMVPTVSNQGSLGAVPRWIRRGYIAVQIFAVPNVGSGALARLADDVRTCLEGRSITVVGVDEPMCVYAGSTSATTADGAWSMCTVTLPFRADQHR